MATVVVIPVIRASAERSLEEKIAAIKRFFGLPRWVTRNQSAAQPAPKPFQVAAIFSVPASEVGMLDSRTVPKEDVKSLLNLPKSPAKFLSAQTVAAKRERNLIALMEVSKLSKAQKPTTKDHIFKLVESKGSFGAIAEEIGESFPDVPYKSLTSRISEMVKAGTLFVSGKRFNGHGIEVNVYVIPKAK